MLRFWGLFGEAVDDSGVENAQIQSGSTFPFSAICSLCVYCLAMTHRPAAYESLLLFLTSGTAEEVRAAQMWK